MAVHSYECLFLLDPNKASSDWQAVMTEANGLIEKMGAEIVFTRPWGEPKLTYPIRKFRKGAYLLTYFKVDSQKIPQFEADCRLSDAILRHMVIKLHPKIAEEIITQLNSHGDIPHHQDTGRRDDGRDNRFDDSESFEGEGSRPRRR